MRIASLVLPGALLTLLTGALVAPLPACDSLALINDGGVAQQGSEGGPGSGDDGGEGGGGGNTIVQGDTLTKYGGTFTTWATLDASGKVVSLSWFVPLSAVNTFYFESNDTRDYLQVPDAVKTQTVIQSLGMDSRPHGHAPPGVYDVPHMEFHISALTSQGQDGIDCSDSTMPPADNVPLPFVVDQPPFNCIQAMGIHAWDKSAPEYNKERFSYSAHLVYYHGSMNSFEAKAADDLLLQRKSFVYDHFKLAQLAHLGKVTLWPTSLRADYDAQKDGYTYTCGDFINSNQ